MEDITNPEIMSTEQPSLPAEEELTHTDKLIGMIINPVKTFENIAKFPPRTIDWLLPVVITIVFAIISNFVIMSNPNIKYDVTQKQIEQTEKYLNGMVEKGQLSREQADEQIEKVRERMEDSSGVGGRIFQIIIMAFTIFITFFIVSGVYFLFSRFALKGEGTYASAMVANGLPYYISIAAIIIMTIASLIFERYVYGTSLGAFMGKDATTFMGFLLKKIDILTIWALALTAIGLAKMFRSANTTKFLVTIYAIWIVWGLITYSIAKAVPFLSFLAM